MTTATSPNPVVFSWSDRLARRAVTAYLCRIRSGCVVIEDPEGKIICGEPHAEPQARVQVHHVRFYRRLLVGGGLGAAEALMDNDWTADDLTTLVRIFVRNIELADRTDNSLAFVRQVLANFVHWMRKNTRAGAKRNIKEHYDLGNELFKLFLDETLSYSCGIFRQPRDTMKDASLAKMQQVCQRLDLKPTDRLVEIGTGWGGLAMYAAQHYGCHVTTATISEEQYRFATDRIRRAGLEDRVRVVLSDYRDLRGYFDKLVSIEMIEAVGHHYFDTFFRKCCQLLKPEGHMLLQAIVIKDQRFERHIRSKEFIGKYIFPGGCLPSISRILQATSQVSDFRLLHLEDIACHYAETLRRWKCQFLSHLDEVRQLGYSERFIRMWEYYLSYCEAVFEERQVNNVQMVLARSKCQLDPITVWNETSKSSATQQMRDSLPTSVSAAESLGLPDSRRASDRRTFQERIT